MDTFKDRIPIAHGCSLICGNIEGCYYFNEMRSKETNERISSQIGIVSHYNKGVVTSYPQITGAVKMLDWKKCYVLDNKHQLWTIDGKTATIINTDVLDFSVGDTLNIIDLQNTLWLGSDMVAGSFKKVFTSKNYTVAIDLWNNAYKPDINGKFTKIKYSICNFSHSCGATHFITTDGMGISLIGKETRIIDLKGK